MERIEDSETFDCPQCDKKFLHKRSLKRHELTHTGNKPHSCSQCDFRCSDKGNLKRHEKTHTGDKPFSCSQCDYNALTQVI